MMYRCTLWLPASERRGLDRQPGAVVVGTLESAKAWAAAMLEPYRTSETDYSARRNWPAEVEVRVVRPALPPPHHHTQRVGAVVARIQAEVDIVPSVGELGWTP